MSSINSSRFSTSFIIIIMATAVTLSCAGGEGASSNRTGDAGRKDLAESRSDSCCPGDTTPGTGPDIAVELRVPVEVELGEDTPGELACIPDCEDKQCGPDGCGGYCGPCANGYTCCGSECRLYHGSRQCGPDDCGHVESLCPCVGCRAEATLCVDGLCVVPEG